MKGLLVTLFALALAACSSPNAGEPERVSGAGFGPQITAPSGIISGPLVLSATIAPPSLSGGTITNYKPTASGVPYGDAFTVSQGASADTSISSFDTTGLPTNFVFEFYNASSFVITLVDVANAGSPPGTTLTLPDLTNVRLRPHTGAWLKYTGSSVRSAGPLNTNDIGALYVGGAPIGGPKMASNRYYSVPNAGAISTSNALGVGTLRLAMHCFPNAITISDIAVEVTAPGDAGSHIRLTAFADDGYCRPGARAFDAGTVVGDGAASVRPISGLSASLTAGCYWFGAAVQDVTVTQPTIRTMNSGADVSCTDYGTSLPGVTSINGFGRQMTGVTGAVPSTWTDGGGTQIQSTPRIYIRVN